MAVRPARSLILNGAGAGRGQSNLIALFEHGKPVGQRILAGRGASERFAPNVQALLVEAGWQQPLDMVAAIVGPGSFTGLRASLSLAAGLARGWQCRAVGVGLGDALRVSLQRDDATTLCLARRGRVFVDEPGKLPYALPVAEITPGRWPVIAGDAVWGEDALAELTGPQGEALLGKETERLPCAVPGAEGIFEAACQALAAQEADQAAGQPAGSLSDRPAAARLTADEPTENEPTGRAVCPWPLEPLYVDPPEAKPPAGGLRPAPQ